SSSSVAVLPRSARTYSKSPRRGLLDRRTDSRLVSDSSSGPTGISSRAVPLGNDVEEDDAEELMHRDLHDSTFYGSRHGRGSTGTSASEYGLGWRVHRRAGRARQRSIRASLQFVPSE